MAVTVSVSATSRSTPPAAATVVAIVPAFTVAAFISFALIPAAVTAVVMMPPAVIAPFVVTTPVITVAPAATVPVITVIVAIAYL